MSTTITDLTVRTIQANTYDALSSTVGFVAVVALLAILITREMVIAHGSTERMAAVPVLSGFALPLAINWALIVTFRLIDLLR